MKTSRIISIAIALCGLGITSCNMPVHFENGNGNTAQRNYTNHHANEATLTEVSKMGNVPAPGTAVRKTAHQTVKTHVLNTKPGKVVALRETNSRAKEKKTMSLIAKQILLPKKLPVVVHFSSSEKKDGQSTWEMIATKISTWPYIRLAGFVGMIIAAIFCVFLSNRITRSLSQKKKNR